MKHLLLIPLFCAGLLAVPVSGWSLDTESPDKPYRDRMMAVEKELNACLDKDASTADMMECLGTANSKYDDLLNETYKIVRTAVKEDKALFDSLKNEQMSWIKLRDRLMNHAIAEAEGGSIGPMNAVSISIEMLKNRVDLLLYLMNCTVNPE